MSVDASDLPIAQGKRSSADATIGTAMAKKLTTQEILAAARAQAAGGAPEQDEAATTEASDAAAESGSDDKAAAAPEAASPSAGGDTGGAGSAAPKSTKGILAAARASAAGKSGGGEKPAPASSAAKPAAAKSTSDILAAARAQAGKGETAAKGASSSPQAASKPKQPTASEPSGERPSVQEMLKAVREGKLAAPEVAAKPAPLLVPQKPPVAARPVGKKTGAKQTRRNVLIAIVATPFAFAWTMFAAAAGVFTVGLARFMMPNVLVEPPSKFKVGPPSNYPPGAVSTKWKSQFAVWIVHNQYAGKDIIYALKSVCTHLGCTPNWLEGEQKFKCPCHGSGFYMTGVNFEGPAPRPLERYGIQVSPDGMLEIDKSVTFNQEKGQWSDTASFVDAATV